LEEEYPYVVLDARYERVREDGVVKNRAVLVATPKAFGAGRGGGE
jgi:putative transposase